MRILRKYCNFSTLFSELTVNSDSFSCSKLPSVNTKFFDIQLSKHCYLDVKLETKQLLCFQIKHARIQMGSIKITTGLTQDSGHSKLVQLVFVSHMQYMTKNIVAFLLPISILMDFPIQINTLWLRLCITYFKGTQVGFSILCC